MIRLFQVRSNIRTKESGRRKDYFMQSFFYDRLMDVLDKKQYSFMNVRRWTMFFEVFTRERIFIVINEGNFHWIAVILYMTTCRIVVVDSMAAEGWTAFHREVVKNIMQWLGDEWESKKGFAFNSDRWTHELRSCPQQDDGKCVCLQP